MDSVKKINLLELKNKYILGLCIPEIQRDYVMGAGGKDFDGKDKLEKFLDSILKKCRQNEDFDFSCIITYCNNPKNNPLEIYDGQQRLTTLMIMILYKLQVENKDVTQFANWYNFMGRPKANEIFDLLTKKGFKIDDIKVTDFTSFSIKNLLKKIALEKYNFITSNYLLNRIKFNMVSIEKQNEIEQFFMDLNSGVKLKDYELYKSKLTHRVNQLKLDQENIFDKTYEIFEMWPHKLDNEWLNFFDIFADYENPAEKYEIEFIKYCINMINIENNEEKNNMQVNEINAYTIIQVYNIMEAITKLDLICFKNENEELLKWKILCYSWEKDNFENKCLDKNKEEEFYNYKRRGAFWNLDYKKYDKMLYYVIKFVLLDASKNKEMKEDVLLWCLIRTLNWKIDFQYEYLRLIKIILNHNVVENIEAWYECQAKGAYLYYCKYTTYGIPQYYGTHLKISKDNNSRPKDYSEKFNLKDAINKNLDMFLLNKLVIENVKMENILNKNKIVNSLMKQINSIILEIDIVKEEIKKIINDRIQFLQTLNYDEYYIKENEVFGILEKIENPVEDGRYYLGHVKLKWPTRGNDGSLDCLVRLKCKTDLLFAIYDEVNDNIVKELANSLKHKNSIDRCFWKETNVNQIIHREAKYSKTYDKYDILILDRNKPDYLDKDFVKDDIRTLYPEN